MRSFSTVAVLALLSGSALANEAINARAAADDSIDLAARAEIDRFVNKFKGFTDDEKNRIKDTVSFGFKKLDGAKKGGKKDAKNQSSKPKRAAPGKAPAPPSGRPGPGAAGILGGAGAAAGTNIGLKKLLNETRHHNGTRHHKGDRHNKTRGGVLNNGNDSILTNLFERAPAKSGSGSGVGSAVAGGVASGAASAGLSNLLNEIESHFKRQVFAIGEIDGHPIDPKLNHGNTGSSPFQEGSSGGVIRERSRDDILREIQGRLQRRAFAEESAAISRRALDNHDAYFADLLAARNAGTIDDLD